MKKIKIFIAIFVLISVFAMGYVLGLKLKTKEKINIEPKFVGLEKNLTLLNKDIEVYKNFDYYLSLLDDEEYEYIEEKITKFSESDEMTNSYGLFILSELFKDEKTKSILTSLKDKVNAVKNRQLTKEEENELFEKNTSCSNLVTEISKGLKASDSKTVLGVTTTTEEKLSFVFYSPTKKACLYVVEKNVRYSDINNWEKGYTTTTKLVYNASTQTLLGSYETFSLYYGDSDSDRKSRSEETTENQRNFQKFILENSNYNIDLLK